MKKLMFVSVLLASVMGLAACDTDVYYPDQYYSSSGYVKTYQSEATTGYNRQYARRTGEHQKVYASTQTPGGGYTSSGSSVGGGYSSSGG